MWEEGSTCVLYLRVTNVAVVRQTEEVSLAGSTNSSLPKDKDSILFHGIVGLLLTS